MRRPFTIRGNEPVYSALGPEVCKEEQALRLYWSSDGDVLRADASSRVSCIWAADHCAKLFPAEPALYYSCEQGWVKA